MVNSWDLTMTGVEGAPWLSPQSLEDFICRGCDSWSRFIKSFCCWVLSGLHAGLQNRAFFLKNSGRIMGLMGYARTEDIPQALANSDPQVLSVLVDHIWSALRMQCKSHKREWFYDRENFVKEVWPEKGHDLNDDIQKGLQHSLRNTSNFNIFRKGLSRI
jgi:hypothetical protein